MYLIDMFNKKMKLPAPAEALKGPFDADPDSQKSLCVGACRSRAPIRKALKPQFLRSAAIGARSGFFGRPRASG